MIIHTSPLLQYMFEIKKDVEEVMISLQQKDMKIHRKEGQGENLTIGFGVFKVKSKNSSTTPSLDILSNEELIVNL